MTMIMLYSLLCSTTNPMSVNKDELVKAVSKWHIDHSSSLNNEVPELPMRGYLQYSDIKKQEFLVGIPGGGDDQDAEIEEIYDDVIAGVNDVMEETYNDVVLATTPTFSIAMKSAEHEKPATFRNEGENSTMNQLIWQDKMETSDYMTLVRRPEDSETSDYMKLVRRPEDSETSDYMTLVKRPEDSETSDYMTLVRRPEDSETSDYMTLVRRPEDSETSDYMTLVRRPEDNVYESLTSYRDTPSLSASSKD